MEGDVEDGRVRRTVRGAVTVLALGAVSWAWSEVGFWAQFRAGDSAPVWVLTWLAYSLVTGLALRVVRRFPAGGPAALILGGAVYGWLVEGVVASTVYTALPFSVVWTGVAWHGLITVGIGWWALPALLRTDARRAALLCAGVGVAWGVWSAGWWAAPPDEGQVAAVPTPSYAVFALVVWAAAAVGYAVLDRVPPAPDALRSRWATAACVAVVALWAGVTILPAIPWAPVVLAALLGLAWFSLRRLSERDDDPRPPTAGSWPVGVPVRRLAPTLLVPVLATAVYAALSPLAGPPGEGPLVGVLPLGIGLTSVAGMAALAWSLWRAWRPRTATGSASDPSP